MSNNVTVCDNGSCFMLVVNGLSVEGFSSLGEAWKHIEWMYRVATQQFTVGKNKTPVTEWLKNMYKMGYLENTYHILMKEVNI